VFEGAESAGAFSEGAMWTFCSGASRPGVEAPFSCSIVLQAASGSIYLSLLFQRQRDMVRTRESAATFSIERLEVGPLNEQTIRAKSVVEVKNAKKYRNDSGRQPVPHGLMDTRMGVVRAGLKCGTCGQGRMGCRNGHSGHIELSIPVINPIFKDHVFRLLACTCRACGALLTDQSQLMAKLRGISRTARLRHVFDIITPLKAGSTCETCQLPQPRYKQDQLGISAHWHSADLTRLREEIDLLEPADGTLILDVLGLTHMAASFDHAALAATGNVTDDTFSVYQIHRHLQRITDATAEFLGFITEVAHPRDLMFTVLEVPAVPLRSQQSDDMHVGTGNGVVQMYGEIIKRNLIVGETLTQAGYTVEEARVAFTTGKPVPEPVVRASHDLMMSIMCLITRPTTTVRDAVDTEGAKGAARLHLPGVRKAVGRRAMDGLGGEGIPSALERLSGKYGVLRHQTQGKRVDFVARSVIVPDSTLDPDELGVPMCYATALSLPERVTSLNWAELVQAVSMGPGAGGAIIVDVASEWGEADSIRLEQCVEEERHSLARRLQVGDVVHRCLREGDYVLFGRQPTLHKYSLLALRVCFRDGRAFGLCEVLCKGLNADFDGDEMNLHVPQNMTARAEMMALCSPVHCLIDPARSTPFVALIQDALEGLWSLGQNGFFLQRQEVFHLLSALRHFGPMRGAAVPPPAILKPQKLWTGRQVLSMVCGDITHFRERAIAPGASDDHLGSSLLVRHGTIIRGEITKGVLHRHAGLIFATAVNPTASDRAAARFVGDLARLGVAVSERFPLSITLRDITVSRRFHDTITGIIGKAEELREECDARVQEIVRHADSETRTQLASFVCERLEAYASDVCFGTLDAARAMLYECFRATTNTLFRMAAVVGSRGNVSNVTQMLGLAGQQLIDYRRPCPHGAAPRVSPYFRPGDRRLTARGLATNAIAEGFTPEQFLAHAGTTREGLVKSAIAPADTGYLHRRLIRCLEMLIACSDASVRTSVTGDYVPPYLIQPCWGGDGLDTSLSVKLDLAGFATMGDSEIAAMVVPHQLASAEQRALRQAVTSLADAYAGQPTSTLFRLVAPADPRDFFMRSMLLERMEGGGGGHGHGDFAACFKAVDTACATLQRIFGERRTWSAVLALRMLLCTGNLVQHSGECHHGVTSSAVNAACVEYVECFVRFAVSSGESLGVIIAQGISAPATQGNLNSFHLSAGGNMAGVPRLVTLTRLRQMDPGEYVTTLPLVHDDIERARALQRSLRVIYLKEITTMVESLRDEALQRLFQQAREGGTITDETPTLARTWGAQESLAWRMLHVVVPDTIAVERLELDRGRMQRLHLSLEETVVQCEAHLATLPRSRSTLIITTKTASGQPVLLVAQRSDTCTRRRGVNIKPTLSAVKLTLIPMRGIDGIERVEIERVPRWVLAASEGSGRRLQQRQQLLLKVCSPCLSMAMRHPDVCWWDTQTSDLHSVYWTLGKHAFAVVLFRELLSVVSHESDSGVQHAYMLLLADFMTHRASPMRIDGPNILKLRCAGLFDKLTFERVTQQVSQNVAFGVKEKIAGTSARIMVGARPLIGTELVDLRTLEGRPVAGRGSDPVRMTYPQIEGELCEPELELRRTRTPTLLSATGQNTVPGTSEHRQQAFGRAASALAPQQQLQASPSCFPSTPPPPGIPSYCYVPSPSYEPSRGPQTPPTPPTRMPVPSPPQPLPASPSYAPFSPIEAAWATSRETAVSPTYDIHSPTTYGAFSPAPPMCKPEEPIHGTGAHDTDTPTFMVLNAEEEPETMVHGAPAVDTDQVMWRQVEIEETYRPRLEHRGGVVQPVPVRRPPMVTDDVQSVCPPRPSTPDGSHLGDADHGGFIVIPE